VATKEEARLGAEARFKKAKQKAAAENAAMADYAAAAATVSAKTARLRALRLEKEATAPAAAPTRARRSKAAAV